MVVGRSGIEAAASGRGDRWTVYQQPEQYAARDAASRRPAEQSVRVTGCRDGYAVVRLTSFTSGRHAAGRSGRWQDRVGPKDDAVIVGALATLRGGLD